jgi:predicted MFS family arabinose efflux permease
MSPSKLRISIRELGVPYQLLFVSGVLSDIGGFSTVTALQVHVSQLTHGNASFMGLISVATLLPMIIAAPIGGVWAEKYNRRTVMVVNDLVRIPLVLLMAMTQSVWLLLLLHGCICACTALFMPSRQSLIPELVPSERLLLANSLSSGVISLVHMLGPPLGVLIYHLTGGLTGVVIIEAIAYLVSALLLVRLPSRPRLSQPSADFSLIREVVDGMRYVKSEPDLRQILIILVTAGAAIGLLMPLLLPFVHEVLHGSDQLYATLIFWFGLGGLIGPFVGHALGRFIGLGRTLILCALAEALLLTLWSRAQDHRLSIALLVLWGIEVFALIPCYTSYLHTYAKRELMGRTFALFDQAVYVPQIASALVVVSLGNRLPTQALLTGAGICYFTIIASTLWSQGARRLIERSGQVPPTVLAEGPPPPP